MCLLEVQDEYKKDILKLWKRVDIGYDINYVMLMAVIYKIYIHNTLKFKNMSIEDLQFDFNKFMSINKKYHKYNKHKNFKVVDTELYLVDTYVSKYIEKHKNNEQ